MMVIQGVKSAFANRPISILQGQNFCFWPQATDESPRSVALRKSSVLSTASRGLMSEVLIPDYAIPPSTFSGFQPPVPYVRNRNSRQIIDVDLTSPTSPYDQLMQLFPSLSAPIDRSQVPKNQYPKTTHYQGFFPIPSTGWQVPIKAITKARVSRMARRIVASIYLLDINVNVLSSVHDGKVRLPCHLAPY